MNIKTVSLIALSLSLAACGYNEGLDIENITGTVVISGESITRDYPTESQPIEDIRNIGPVYLGVYPGILEENRLAAFPHPEVGPSFDGNQGDAYPYGGVSIGNYRPMCLQALQCKVVSGRFIDWEAMATWFTETLDEPIVDYFGDPAESGEFIRQTCMEAFNHTTDFELGLTAYDKNEDESVDELDLDFQRREDGMWEGEFIMYQQEFFEDTRVEEGRGMTLWGWMDAPSPGTGSFTTCVEGGSISRTVDYNQNFRAGINFRSLLNRPSSFIRNGDLVAGDQGNGEYGWVFEDKFDNPELFLNFEVQ